MLMKSHHHQNVSCIFYCQWYDSQKTIKSRRRIKKVKQKNRHAKTVMLILTHLLGGFFAK